MIRSVRCPIARRESNATVTRPPARHERAEANDKRSPLDEDRQEITRQQARFVRALNTSNARALQSVLTDDVVIIPPNHPAVFGMTGAQVFFQAAFFDAFSVQLESSIREVIVAGDWAIERGDYTMILTAADTQQASTDSGGWLAVWQRQRDGVWRLARHMWNSDRPRGGSPVVSRLIVTEPSDS